MGSDWPSASPSFWRMAAAFRSVTDRAAAPVSVYFYFCPHRCKRNSSTATTNRRTQAMTQQLTQQIILVVETRRQCANSSPAT
jgi:hypothetical protein